MKKKLILILGTFAAVLLAALLVQGTASAKSSNTRAVYYQMFKEGSADVRLTYYHRKGSDRVTKQVTQNTITYAALKVDDAEAAKEKLSDEAEKYQGITGVKESIDYKDTYLVEKVSVDYNKADLDELAEKLPEIDLDTPSGKRAAYISLKKSEKLLKKQGYTKVKKGQFQKLNLE
ncbi:DUF1307 domain-containing protein [Streptococcus devriesei]|uniref:DUF1307 domain-containing protein n=1 Tax=Streptococcus devriesei TaxID=231233 RepID=UPI0004012280|nr:DUF1307 domain-containing protein [Streptococcus devriesei]